VLSGSGLKAADHIGELLGIGLLTVSKEEVAIGPPLAALQR
jgi:hypothetical protein